MTPTLAIVLGALLIGGLFAAFFALTVHDMGWRDAAKGWLIALSVTALIGVGASLLAWGLTR